MTTRNVKRVRHPSARRRSLLVREKTKLSPNYLSIRFECTDFEDFSSMSPDDHIKLFLGGPPGADGRPAMRDYTPRSWDTKRGEFVIEFALHEGPGPATAWAIKCQVGDRLEIGGPRGSTIVPDDYDWYWLIGDEAAIPAIARRMDEWPEQEMDILINVQNAEEEIDLPASLAHKVHWVHRPVQCAADPSTLLEVVRDKQLPEGEGFVWIASEAGVAKALREALLEKGHPLNQMKAAGYWTSGHADTVARF